ncbi:MAG: hypothetical protein HOJ25_00345 [Candidatus Magasanikbacteria bacterium]|jgi:vancomycin resistance protein YoaR|nr:hypothetical protein [Candidatus Magasanikbacteria bacterium]MBT6294126.1 hypothetical protein [Candidatus Magasanikbacteria bacterium]
MKKMSKKIGECITRFSWTGVGWICGTLTLLLAGCLGVSLVYANGFDQRVIPGVTIAETPIGGMHRDELKDFLHSMNDRLVEAGASVQIDTNNGDTSFTLYPVIVTDGGSVDLFSIDVEKEVDALVHIGKRGDIFTRMHNIFKSKFNGYNTSLQYVSANKEKIDEVVDEFLVAYETPPKNAQILLSDSSSFAYDIEPEQIGYVYDRGDMTNHILEAWSKLQVPEPIVLSRETHVPEIVVKDLEPLQEQLQEVFDLGDMALTHTNPQTGKPQSWSIEKEQLADWVSTEMVDGGTVIVSLDREKVAAHVADIVAPDINITPLDAKFSMTEEGKVTQFQQSRPGVEVDVEQTTEALVQAFGQRSLHKEGIQNIITVITTQKEPQVSTGQSNDLGIKEIIGVGKSSYSGSPTNRIKNITNAVNKLNGILIPPGEEFSTIDFTKPYSEEGGYLSELVIKGDEIKPEIGGGLCQIGTTLFRMAMMSGMEITERRNHSLVVGYYNDARNGLPGTDATIYDPAPDFRFKNDTSHHVLIQAAMDTKNQDLVFTLWGAGDGRTATYSKPEVLQWIPHGETRIVETTKIAPGERECQHAFKGANTSFTYSRTLANGVVEDIVYESHYRPLPEICLVGIEEGENAEEEETLEPTGETELIEGVDPNNPFGGLEL